MHRLARLGVVAILMVAVSLLAMAACSKPAADQVDRDRAAYLSQDSLVTAAVEPLTVHVGVVYDGDFGWDRSTVDAVVYRRAAGAPAPVPSLSDVAARVVAVLATARGGGWHIIYASCEPSDSIVAGPTGPTSTNQQADYVLVAYGYRIVDGVSYWLSVRSDAQVDGRGFIEVVLRAPNRSDTNDLFADRPAELTNHDTCIEGGPIPARKSTNGQPIVLAERLAHPAVGGDQGDPLSR